MSTAKSLARTLAHLEREALHYMTDCELEALAGPLASVGNPLSDAQLERVAAGLLLSPDELRALPDAVRSLLGGGDP